MYAVDVWCIPTRKELPKHKGMAKVIRQLTTIQRAGTIAITGRLCSSPMDTLDATIFLLPAPLLVDKWCHRALVQMAMLPLDHLLY